MKASTVGRGLQQRLVSLAQRVPLLTAVAHAAGRRRAAAMLPAFRSSLPATGRTLDVGTGTGHIAEALAAEGHAVTGCDVIDLRLCPVSFAICDGGALPFRAGEFDAVLLVTVMHHVPSTRHERLLAEAFRVLRGGGRLVLFEDTYHTRVERWTTGVQDSLMNAEFSGHPHSNRPLASWKQLLTDLGGTIRHEHEYVAWYACFRIRHGVLVAERTQAHGAT